MADLSTVAASNSPAGSESPISTDDFHRAIQAILRHTNAKGLDIASAATIDLGAATGEFVDITGTTTITSLGTVAAGIVRRVRFTGILTLTHNATSLILPGSANITTANGDCAQFVSLGSGNWLCEHYVRRESLGILPSQLQKQTFTAFTTGGTASAYTLTPSPAITANATNTRFNITLHLAPTGSPTLAVSGQTAKSLKYYDSTGAKQFITSAVAPLGWNSDVIDDGTDWVMQDILPIATVFSTSSEIKTGTEAAKAIAPNNLLAAQGFTAYFESAQQTITSAGLLTIAHGLGRRPVLTHYVLVNTTAEQGYSVGDYLYIPGSTSNSAADNKGISSVMDATNLSIRYGAAAAVFDVLTKTTGSGVSLTNANWRLIVRAWA
jgi:hypothetical protein